MNNLYIVRGTVTSMQVDTSDSENLTSPETTESERAGAGSGNAGFAPISPETPSWGPPSGTENNEPGFAPISPETPSFGPPSGSENNEPGFAPISPETPSFGPPSGSNNNEPGFAPISPETPAFRPPSGAGGSTSGSNPPGNTPSGSNPSGGIITGGIITGGTTSGMIPCPTCGTGWITTPIVVIPGQGNQSTSGMSNIRFLYAATGQPPVNIRLGNERVINRMQYGNSTPYYLENAGYQTVLITNSNTGRILYRGIFYFNSRTAYTLAIINSGSGISLMQLIDTPCTNRGAACVRAVNLSPNSGAVDVFLSGAGRIFQSVDTYGTTSYRAINQGAYRVSVSEALPCTSNSSVVMAGSYVECNNTRIAVLDSASVNFMSGVSYTIYLIGLAYQLPAAQILTLESDLIY